MDVFWTILIGGAENRTYRKEEGWSFPRKYKESTKTRKRRGGLGKKLNDKKRMNSAGGLKDDKGGVLSTLNRETKPLRSIWKEVRVGTKTRMSAKGFSGNKVATNGKGMGFRGIHMKNYQQRREFIETRWSKKVGKGKIQGRKGPQRI